MPSVCGNKVGYSSSSSSRNSISVDSSVSAAIGDSTSNSGGSGMGSGESAAAFENSSLGAALQIVDKKVRNLEKRKGKLDGYKADSEKGKVLNEDQKNAVSNYKEVISNLDFARELSGQFKSLAIDEDKNRKKQLKKESIERSKNEIAKIAFILDVQNILMKFKHYHSNKDNFNGLKDDHKLTESEIKQLEELMEILFPSLAAQSSSPIKKNNKKSTEKNAVKMNDFSTVADHYVSLFEGKNKKPNGANTNNTFQDYKNLIFNVKEYFDSLPFPTMISAPVVKTEPEVPATPAPIKIKDEPVSPQPSIPVSIKAEPVDYENHEDSPTSSSEDDHVTVTINGDIGNQNHLPKIENGPSNGNVNEYNNYNDHHQTANMTGDAASKGAADPMQIVPPSNFNFLQESTIDPINMDPAVVVVRNSPPQQHQHQHQQQQQQQQHQQQQHHYQTTQNYNNHNQMYMAPTTMTQIQHQHQASNYQQQQEQDHEAQNVAYQQQILHQQQIEREAQQQRTNKKPAPGFHNSTDHVKQTKEKEHTKNERQTQQPQTHSNQTINETTTTQQPLQTKPIGYAAAAAGFHAMPPVQRQENNSSDDNIQTTDWSLESEMEENRDSNNKGERGGSRGGRGGRGGNYRGRREGGDRGYRGRGGRGGGEGGFRREGRGAGGRGGVPGNFRGDKREGGGNRGRGGRGHYRGNDRN